MLHHAIQADVLHTHQGFEVVVVPFDAGLTKSTQLGLARDLRSWGVDHSAVI